MAVVMAAVKGMVMVMVAGVVAVRVMEMIPTVIAMKVLDLQQHLTATIIDFYRFLLNIIAIAIDVIKWGYVYSQIGIIKPDGR